MPYLPQSQYFTRPRALGMSDPVAVDWTSCRCLCCHSVHYCCPFCCCPRCCCLGCNFLVCHFVSCQEKKEKFNLLRLYINVAEVIEDQKPRVRSAPYGSDNKSFSFDRLIKVKKKRRAMLNVGGVKHEVMWGMLLQVVITLIINNNIAISIKKTVSAHTHFLRDFLKLFPKYHDFIFCEINGMLIVMSGEK